MIYIYKEYDALDGNHYCLMQTYSTCCKEKMLFKRISEKKWFNMETLEECSETWNNLIENAIDNKKFLPKYLCD